METGDASMKALSVKQPWAWLIVSGYKDIENRTWHTEFRGRIYIHASGRYVAADYRDVKERLRTLHIQAAYPHLYLPYPPDLTYGAIIGEVDLVDCIDTSLSFWAEEGLWHWVLSKPVAYVEPIRYRGQLGLFEVKL
jgi:hypothetical protein